MRTKSDAWFLHVATFWCLGGSPEEFFKICQSWPLFVYFRSFHIQMQMYNLNNINLKKCRLCSWDSNLGWQDGRCKQIHWAMAAPPEELVTFCHWRIRATREGVIKNSKYCSTPPLFYYLFLITSFISYLFYKLFFVYYNFYSFCYIILSLFYYLYRFISFLLSLSFYIFSIISILYYYSIIPIVLYLFYYLFPFIPCLLSLFYYAYSINPILFFSILLPFLLSLLYYAYSIRPIVFSLFYNLFYCPYYIISIKVVNVGVRISNPLLII